MTKPTRVINAAAPIRICDVGGWTDTWFAEYGSIFNIAVYPFVESQVFVYDRGAREERIVVFAENYGEQFAIDENGSLLSGKHALLEAAFSFMEVPEEVSIEVHLYSPAPAGASTGTSAAASVALIGALDLLTPGRMSAAELAETAQRIETEKLGLQCGIQDQLAAAYGGVNFIRMSSYPLASVSPLQLPPSVWWELDRRLMLVYIGSAHVSSDVHVQVIRNFEETGSEDPRLCGLRQEAERAKNAVLAGDFAALAAAMNANTEWQAQMHADILSENARTVIDAARDCGAQGWKLNGASGAGGSVTLLFGDASRSQREFTEKLAEALPQASVIPIHLSSLGLRVWESDAG